MGLGWQLSNGYLDKNGGLGGNQTYMAFDPTTKIGVFVFGNTSGGDAGGVLTKTGRILLGELRGFPAEPSVFPQPQSVPQCP
jgi:CubicO group peptidase (beta-lactamase class C family)